MAYFANGTEGMCFDEQCTNCIFGEKPCPISAAQMNFNYDASGNKTATNILDMLVKNNGTCTMFEEFKKELLPYIDHMNKGKLKIPNRLFFKTGYIWANFLDEDLRDAYYRLETYARDIIINAKPTGDEIKDLEMKAERLDILVGRLAAAQFELQLNVNGVSDQIVSGKKNPKF